MWCISVNLFIGVDFPVALIDTVNEELRYIPVSYLSYAHKSVHEQVAGPNNEVPHMHIPGSLRALVAVEECFFVSAAKVRAKLTYQTKNMP